MSDDTEANAPAPGPRQFYVKTDTFLDKFTDSGFLIEHLPQVKESLAVAKGWRDFYHQTGTGGAWGPEMRHIASINPDVAEVAGDFHWNIFESPAKFHAWLDKHPECKVVK